MRRAIDPACVGVLRICDMSRLFGLNYFEFPPMEVDGPGPTPIAAFDCSRD
jgi:hypothetical protein